MHRIFISGLNILLCGILLFQQSYAADKVEGTKPPKSYHIYEDVRLIPTTKFFYYKPKIVIKAVFPYIDSDIEDENIDQFNELVKGIISDEVEQFKKRVTDSLPDLEGFPASDIKNDLSIDFNTSVVNGDGSPTISLRFSMQGYIAGMAHPIKYHRVITYDLYNGQQIQLIDLFKPEANYLELLSSQAKRILSKQLKYKSILEEGLYPTEENFKIWNINPEGILITFDPGQVAPRVYGTQNILIPYSAIKEDLAKDSPVSACIKHRSKCRRDTLLTGGFIEEASLKSRARGFFQG